MYRVTQSGRQIEIDTYTDTNHMINICKHFGFLPKSHSVEDLRWVINSHLREREDNYL